MNKRNYLGYVVSAVILLIIVYTFEWDRVIEELAGFDYWVLLPALVIYVAGFMVRAVRWQYMLSPLKRIHFSSSFAVTMVGWMANNVLPLRMGEFVRAWAVKKKEDVSASASFATIVIERVFDGLALVGLFAVVLLLFDTARAIKIWGIAMGALFPGVLLILWLAVRREAVTRRYCALLLRIMPGHVAEKGAALLDSFLSGLRFLSSLKRQMVVALFSCIIWGMEAVVFWIIMRGFDMAVPPFAAIITLVIVNIAIMIPAMPGYIGTFEGAAVIALVPFGVGQSLAGSYIIIVHALQYVSVTALGLYYMNTIGWSLRDFKRVEKQ